jgi:hypothetical protein
MPIIVHRHVSVQHPDAEGGSEVSLLIHTYLPASDLERWTKPLRGRLQEESIAY